MWLSFSTRHSKWGLVQREWLSCVCVTVFFLRLQTSVFLLEISDKTLDIRTVLHALDHSFWHWDKFCPRRQVVLASAEWKPESRGMKDETSPMQTCCRLVLLWNLGLFQTQVHLLGKDNALLKAQDLPFFNKPSDFVAYLKCWVLIYSSLKKYYNPQHCMFGPNCH